MIDIKQHALRALEQYPFAIAACFVEAFPDRLGILQNAVGDILEVSQEPVPVHRRFAKSGTQRIMMGAKPVELRPEIIEMSEIADPDRAATHLVLIGRADAAAGGADLALAAGVLAQRVQITMDRQDQRTGFGDAEIVGVDGDALAFQLLDLVAQMPGIEHDAVANDRQRPAHDARGEQGKLVHRAIDNQRMAGVVAALKTDHDIGTFG